MSFHNVRAIPTDFKIPQSCSSNSYKLVVLPNGLLTLIVSNPESSRAITALSVATGSHNDGNTMGLAHLCEHMVLSGSKMFPHPQGLRKVLSQHKGSVNAYTQGEQTTFHFDIEISPAQVGDEPIFDHCIRHFASGFISALFNESRIEAEINAVHGEHTRNVSDPERVLHHGMRLVASQNHPFHQFGTGDKFTLHRTSVSVLRNLLVAYYREHYVSEKMTLVVEGPQSVNHLQKLVLATFGAIPTSGKRRQSSISVGPSSELPLNILKSNYDYASPVFSTGKFVHIHSHNPPRLRIIFPIDTRIEHADFFLQCWCSLLGDESEGSLSGYLVHTKRFIRTLYASIPKITSELKAVVLDFALSHKGVNHLQELVSILFGYIAVHICRATAKLSRYVNDIYVINNLNFHFSKPAGNAYVVALLAQSLQWDLESLGVDNLIRGYKNVATEHLSNPQWRQHLLSDFVTSSCQFLSQANSCMVFIGSEVDSIVSYLCFNDSLHDCHYNLDYTRYSIMKFPMVDVAMIEELSVPASNPYLTDSWLHINLDNVTSHHDNYFGTKGYRLGDVQSRLLEYQHHYELWFQYCPFLNTSSVSFSMELPKTMHFPHSESAMAVLAGLIGQKLQPQLYPAEMIGYQWGVYANWNDVPSLGFHVSGLSLGIMKVVDRVVETATRFLIDGVMEVTEAEFLVAKENHRQSLELISESSGIEQAILGSVLYTESMVADLATRVEQLQGLTLIKMRNMVKTIMSEVKYTRVLISSDKDASMAKQLSSIINDMTDHICLHEVDVQQFSSPPSLMLPCGTHYHWKQHSLNPGDMMTTVSYYIQCGHRHDRKSRTMVYLMHFFLDTHAMPELRGRRQLGYSVVSSLRLSRGSTGLMILVSTPKPNQDQEIISHIESFLGDMALKLETMSEEQFDQEIVGAYHPVDSTRSSLFFRGTTAGHVDIHDSTLSTHHWQSWERIYNHDYLGPLCDPEISLVTLSQFRSYFNNVISPASVHQRVFSVCIAPNLSDEKQLDIVRERLKEYATINRLKVSDAEIQAIALSSPAMDVAFERLMYAIHGQTKMKFIKAIKRIKAGKKSTPPSGRIVSNVVEISRLDEFIDICAIIEPCSTGIYHWLRLVDDMNTII